MADLIQDLSSAIHDLDQIAPPHRAPPAIYSSIGRVNSRENVYRTETYLSDDPLDEFDRQLLGSDIPKWPNERNEIHQHYNHPRYQDLHNMRTTTLSNDNSFQPLEQQAKATQKTSLLARFGYRGKTPPTPKVSDEDNSSPAAYSSPTALLRAQRGTSLHEAPGTTPTTSTFPSTGCRGRSEHRISEKIFSSRPRTDLVVQGVALVAVDQLPDRFCSIFPYPVFNAVQSKCFDVAYNGDHNLVVSAPTGSGKTVILELAICSLLKTLEQGTYKAIYLAPTKALCSEKKRGWDEKFRNLGLSCTELTGDTDQVQLSNVRKGDLIVTTPEKWDSMTRKWNDHRKLLDLVRLVLIDEVHILKETRGATLEVVVSRMKTIGSHVRFVALSATVPNSSDIAAWLGRSPSEQNLPAQEERFGSEFRPVKLEKYVYGFQCNTNDFAFDKTLDQKLPDILRKHSAGKPVMIFCMTRGICVGTAKSLSAKWNKTRPQDRCWNKPRTQLSFKDKDLQVTAETGVAFHHAGLDIADRTEVEALYLQGELQVICCTSTLAVGVNLPAHLVIVKNTVAWGDGGAKEYAASEIMQMLGRAGRPQFDDTGVAVILTRKEKTERYERMGGGAEVLESCLHENLVEHLNAEIGLRTINDFETASQWLRSTFLYIRLQKNPRYYKIARKTSALGTHQRLEDICERDIKILADEQMVSRSGDDLQLTKYGESMARYYVRFGTMCKIMKIKPAAKVCEILMILSEADEFGEVRFRSGEKGLYKEINRMHDLRYPLKVHLSSAAHKVYVLLQFEIGLLDFPMESNLQKYKGSLNQDKNQVYQHCHRIICCILDCLIERKDGVGVKNALELARSLRAKAWEGSANELRQIEGLGPVSVNKLVNSGIRSLEALEACQPSQIETFLSRNPPFGANILKNVKCIPRFKITARQMGETKYGRDSVSVRVRVDIGFINAVNPARFRGSLNYANFVATRSDGELLEFRKIPVFQLEGGKDIKFAASFDAHGQTIYCYISCEQIVGTLTTCTLRPNIKASAVFPKKEFVESEQHDESLRFTEFVKASCSDDEYGISGYDEAFNELDLKGVEFRNIDDFHQKSGHHHISLPTIEAAENEATEEPAQLSNGKWQCRHKCSDKTKCKHLCCREGIDKPREPRAPPQKKDLVPEHVEIAQPEQQPRAMVAPKITKELSTAPSWTSVNRADNRVIAPRNIDPVINDMRIVTEVPVIDLADNGGPLHCLSKLRQLHAHNVSHTKVARLVKSSKIQPNQSQANCYPHGRQPSLNMVKTSQPLMRKTASRAVDFESPETCAATEYNVGNGNNCQYKKPENWEAETLSTQAESSPSKLPRILKRPNLERTEETGVKRLRVDETNVSSTTIRGDAAEPALFADMPVAVFSSPPPCQSNMNDLDMPNWSCGGEVAELQPPVNVGSALEAIPSAGSSIERSEEASVSAVLDFLGDCVMYEDAVSPEAV